MSYENMFALPDYDGGPADRLRDSVYKYPVDWAREAGIVIRDPDGWRTAGSPSFRDDKITKEDFNARAAISTVSKVRPIHKENRKTDWVETEHRVIMDQETLAEYSNEVGLDDIIKAGIHALGVGHRWSFVGEECTDAGF